MNIQATPIKQTTDSLSCPFCNGYLDFIFQESLGKGLTFRCFKCAKELKVTSFKQEVIKYE